MKIIGINVSKKDLTGVLINKTKKIFKFKA